MSANESNDYEEIVKLVTRYLDGARLGSGEEMRPSFHEDATIFGYVGEDLFAGPIKNLFSWVNDNGPADGIRPVITNIDVVGSAASVRVDIDDWTGYQFTDFFTLLRTDGAWRIMNKVFHLHSE